MEGVERDALLKAQSYLWNHIFNVINSMSLKCAVELRIPDVIHGHGGSIILSDLATALGLPATKVEPLRRLMRLLVHSGFFAIEGGEREGDDVAYSLSEVSHYFLRDGNINMTPLVLMGLHPLAVTPWHSLSAYFQVDDPCVTPTHLAHGEGIWAVAARQPEFGRAVDDAMASDSRFVMKLVVEECKDVFLGVRSLVDVGGGTGIAASMIGNAFPHIKCSVLELPQVVGYCNQVANVEFVTGNMFEWIPPSDAVLLKFILINWSDEECVKILKRCKEAIPSREDGGKVIVVDMIVRPDKPKLEQTETHYMVDLLMMALTTGKVRSEKEFKKIFMEAGFRDYKVVSDVGLVSVIEVYP